MMLPARLDSLAAVDELTSWPIRTSMFCSGSSPARGRDGLEPADVAVVVGAEQVDLLGRSRGRSCRGSRRRRRRSRWARRCARISTRSLSSPKSVVRSQTAPSSSKTWPCSRSRSTALLDRAGRRAASRSENHTSKCTPKRSSGRGCSASWAVAELARTPRSASSSGGRAGRVALERPAAARSSMYCAGVAVLRRRLALAARPAPSAPKLVHLGAGVVDVVLGGDLGAGGRSSRPSRHRAPPSGCGRCAADRWGWPR